MRKYIGIADNVQMLFDECEDGRWVETYLVKWEGAWSVNHVCRGITEAHVNEFMRKLENA